MPAPHAHHPIKPQARMNPPLRPASTDSRQVAHGFGFNPVRFLLNDLVAIRGKLKHRSQVKIPQIEQAPQIIIPED